MTRSRLNLPALSGGALAGGLLLATAPFLMWCEAPALNPTANLNALNNTRPVARAGADGDAAVGGALALDGTGSYDPDGDEIIYIWSVDSAPENSQLGATPFSANEDRNAGLTTVTPDVEGLFIFALAVEDPQGLRSQSDFVVFNASSSANLPIADAGPNRSGLEREEICLDGGASYDPGGNDLSFDWALVSVPSNSGLTTADVVATDSASCIVPDAPGSYAVALTVNNGLVDSEPDFAFIAAGSTNQGPEGVIEVLEGASCDFVRLSGESSTDPEEDSLIFDWTILLVPGASNVPLGQSAFDDAGSPTPSFYADAPGEYTIQLVVNDGEDYAIPVFYDVVVQPTESNLPPEVVPSPDAFYSAPGPACTIGPYGDCENCPNCAPITVPLDALASSDPDGDLLTISWELVTGPANSGLDVEEGFTNQLQMAGPPGSCTAQINTRTAQVRVTATDCSGATDSSLITVVYSCGP